MKKVFCFVMMVLMIFTFSFGILASDVSLSDGSQDNLVTSSDMDGIIVLNEMPPEPTED